MNSFPLCTSSDVQSKAIEVTVEEPKAQTVRVGATVNFICTAKSKVNWSTITGVKLNLTFRNMETTFVCVHHIKLLVNCQPG